jgi:hypothetical protein
LNFLFQFCFQRQEGTKAVKPKTILVKVILGGKVLGSIASRQAVVRVFHTELSILVGSALCMEILLFD